MPGRGFSSKEYNERTSLSYFGARYYDASLGRFISRDPLGFVDGPNEYIYCANNPIGCVDPYGLWKRTAWNYAKDAGEQFVLGDYTDKTNALGTGLQIAAGIAGVDLIADARDISASFVNWEWSWKHVGKTTLNLVGVLPGIGAIKNIDEAGAVIKGFAKNADEASSLAKGAVKNTDDVTQNVLKSHDDFDEFISTFNSRSKYKSKSLTHGNLKTNTTEATLYGKFDNDGNFLKWGKSQNPQYRYTNTELDGGYVKPYRTGPTDQILDQERKLVERFPGPENNELWSGWKNPTHPNYKETR
jgi:RHS repeat-associated protein